MRKSLLWVAAALVLTIGACTGDGGSEAGIGADGCSLNSDCAPPLVCAFNRCHSQCTSARDCAAGQDCLQADGAGVCAQPNDPSDAAPACKPPQAGPCDIFPQCGCASDQGCDIKSTGETWCVNSGTSGPGASCSGIAGKCAAGSTCLGVVSANGGTSPGLCKSFCDTDADCAAQHGHCLDLPPGYKGFCTIGCNLADPAPACGPGLGCVLVKDFAIVDCAPVGVGVAGDLCAIGPDCAPGHVCWQNNTVQPPVNTCQRWCRLARGNADCPAGSLCVSPSVPILVDGDEFGLCQK